MAEQLAFEVNVKNIMHRAHSTHGQAPLFALGWFPFHNRNFINSGSSEDDSKLSEL